MTNKLGSYFLDVLLSVNVWTIKSKYWSVVEDPVIRSIKFLSELSFDLKFVSNVLEPESRSIAN